MLKIFFSPEGLFLSKDVIGAESAKTFSISLTFGVHFITANQGNVVIASKGLIVCLKFHCQMSDLVMINKNIYEYS